MKNDSYRTFEFFRVKKGLQKTLYTRKMTRFRKSANLVTMRGLYIAFAKCSVLGQKLKCYKKHVKKRFYKHITVVLSQERVKKTNSNKKITTFRKSAKLVTIHGL